MAWNDTTKQYEVDSYDDKLLRLITYYNMIVPNANITLNNIAGSGLEAVFYTHIQHFTFLETALLEGQAKITKYLADSSLQVLRPYVVKDNIPVYAKTKYNIDVCVFDLNDKKMFGELEGIYLVFKSENLTNTAIQDICKNCIPAGVIFRGTSNIDVLLSTSQQIQAKYTVATTLNSLKVRLEYRETEDLGTQTEVGEKLRADLKKAIADSYIFGGNLLANDIIEKLKHAYPTISDFFIYFGFDPDTLVQGSFVVPYENYIDPELLNYEVLEIP